MSGIDLDFRDAVFGPGVSEVHVTSLMAGVAIIVPPHLQVACEGASIMGVFEGMDQGTRQWDPEAPLLRITGSAIMSALEIATRSPGAKMKEDSSAHIGQIGQC